MTFSSRLKFIVDHNVGKLSRWLRLMGYDTLFFNGGDDSELVSQALTENRVVLTRDSELMKRRLITTGRLKAALVCSESQEEQIRQITDAFDLSRQIRPFTLCLECNQPLIERVKEEVRGLVPPYVFQTQNQFMQCPSCLRIYWKGTHWQAMLKKLQGLGLSI